jgi:methyl-accepting chemotaxis protein WspA
MRDLRIWQKLLLLGVVLMVPFAAVTYEMVHSIRELGVEFAQQEARGLEHHRPLLPLLQHLQQHRGMSNALLSGDASFKDKLTAKSAEIEADLRKVDAVDARFGAEFGTHDEWLSLRASCKDLLLRAASLPHEESFALHTRAITETIALIGQVGDASKLILDPDLDSYYLMDIVIAQGPELAEFLAQARGLGSGMAASKKASAEDLEKLRRLSLLIEYRHPKVGDSLNKAMTAGPSLRPALEARTRNTMAAVAEAAEPIRAFSGAAQVDTAAATYYAAVTRGLDALFQLQEQAASELGGLLTARIQRFEREIWLTVAFAALGLVAVALIAYFIIRDITAGIRRAVELADRIAIGDLSVLTAFETRRDEIGVLARAFHKMVSALREMAAVAEQIAGGNLGVSVKPSSDSDVLGNAFAKMISSLSALVGEVHKSGIQVNTSVTQIAATSRQQQATATEIAATTSQIGATSKEISATSRDLVRTMGEVAGVADESATLAGNGQRGLQLMEETMRHVMDAAASINSKLAVLNEKAGNINQVVTTITKVADQTNLLSLNAAIEAEKAGEYGRGFAVVATEIRRLADQTAVATYDIEQMVKEIQSAVATGVMGMDKFSEEVRRGIQEVHEVGAQLSQIIQQVQAMAPRVESVNEGMQAQAMGAEQISQALGQLSEAAQQTVESLGQSNQAIDGLNQAVKGLRGGVARFKLGAAA